MADPTPTPTVSVTPTNSVTPTITPSISQTPIVGLNYYVKDKFGNILSLREIFALYRNQSPKAVNTRYLFNNGSQLVDLNEIFDPISPSDPRAQATNYTVSLSSNTQSVILDLNEIFRGINVTPTPTGTPAASVTPTVTPSITPTVTPSVTPTWTPTVTNTPTLTPSSTPGTTPTPTPTPTFTPTPSVSITPSISITPSVTPAACSSITPTPSISVSNTPTPTVTPSVTISLTPTTSITQSVTPTPSISITASVTPTVTPSISPVVNATVYTVDITGEQPVVWSGSPLTIKSVGTTDNQPYDTHVIEYYRSGTLPIVFDNSWVAFGTPLVGNFTSTSTIIRNEALPGTGYYVFRSRLLRNNVPLASAGSTGFQVINNNVQITLNAAINGLNVDLTSVATANNASANLKFHGIQFLSDTGWTNIVLSAINLQSDTILYTHTPPGYGTWQYRSYATNADDYKVLGTYQYSSPQSVTLVVPEPPKYNLSIQPNPSGLQYGYVTGSGSYKAGDVIPIQAYPNTANGYEFKEWSDDISCLVNSATTNPNTVVMPAQNTVITGVFRLGTVSPTDPFWVNSGYTSNDIYSVTIVEKRLSDPDNRSFTAILSNPNAFPIYVNVAPVNNYGITFGNGQNNVGVNANSTLSVQGSWSGYYGNTDTELNTYVAVSVSNPSTIPTIFYYKLVLPASCYIIGTPYASVTDKYNVTTQSYTFESTSKQVTVYNPNSYPVVLKVKDISGTAATIGAVRWYDENNNLLGNNSKITLNGNENHTFTVQTDIGASGGSNTITLVGINTQITFSTWIALPLYIATVNQSRSSAWFKNYAVWPTCGTFAGQSVGNTIVLFFEGGNYTFQGQADDNLTISVDGVPVLVTSFDSYRNAAPDTATVYIAPGTHVVNFEGYNRRDTGGPAGIGMIITGPGLNWTSRDNVQTCGSPVPIDVDKYLIYDAPFSFENNIEVN